MKLLFIAIVLGILALPAQAQTVIRTQTFLAGDAEIKITPIYHACMLIEGGGKVIYIDPAKPADFSGLPKADLILFTHEHPDHVDQDQTSIKAISKVGTQIWAPAAVAKFVTTATVISNGQTKRFDGWTIEAIPAYNLVRGPAPGEFYHPKGRGNGYLLSYQGKRFYISGDTEGIPEMRALKNIDAAFVCINLPYTMSVDEAAQAVKAFHPKVVFPYHYRGNPPTDLATFKRDLQGTGIEVRSLDWYPAT